MTPDDHKPTFDAAQSALLTRRRLLGLAAMTCGSLIATSGTSQAFFNLFGGFSTPASLDSLNIPKEWMKQLGPQLPSYVDFLSKLKLEHLTVREVIEPHLKSHGRVHNTLPPRQFWKNIRNTMKVVDGLQDRLETPMKEIISAYRSPAYNASCPGAKSNSFHMRNFAMDVTFKCPPGKVAAMARAMRASGNFSGGVGRYAGFTHVDTRGYNADW